MKSKRGIKGDSGLMTFPVEFAISVDTWGVDYAYLDQAGDMIYLPHCYRDNRMGSYEADSIKPWARKQRRLGVQPATINSVLQLCTDLENHIKQNRPKGPLYAGFD